MQVCSFGPLTVFKWRFCIQYQQVICCPADHIASTQLLWGAEGRGRSMEVSSQAFPELLSFTVQAANIRSAKRGYNVPGC